VTDPIGRLPSPHERGTLQKENTATFSRHACDVLVAGSGAGGFAAALTALTRGLDVLMLEKDSVFGGTTAYSAGVIWIPGNGLPPDARKADTGGARDYLAHHVGNRFDASRVAAFLEAGPRMLALFEREGFVAFSPAPTWADYHPTEPGGSNGGRSLVAEIYDGRLLGDWFARLRPPVKTMMVFGGMMVGRTDVPHLFRMARSWRSAAHLAGLVARYGRDRLSHDRGTRLVNGNGLIARMARHALDRHMPLWLSSPSLGSRARTVALPVQSSSAAVEGLQLRRAVESSSRRGGPDNDEMTRRVYEHRAAGKNHVLCRPRRIAAMVVASRRPPADISLRTCTTRQPGRRCRSCPSSTARSPRFRISSIAASPASSPSIPTGNASSTRPCPMMISCRLWSRPAAAKI
jgi:hypothetical protein